MSKPLSQKAMEKTALKFGVSYEEVYCEIESAIAQAVDLADHSSPMLLDFVPRRQEYPTPEDVISFLSDLAAQ